MPDHPHPVVDWRHWAGLSLLVVILGGGLLIRAAADDDPDTSVLSNTTTQPTPLPRTLLPPKALPPTTAPPITVAPTSSIDPAQARVDDLLAEMSLEEKIGQLLMTVVFETELSDADRAALTDHHIGGVFFTATNRNVVSVEQVQSFIDSIQSTTGDISMLISTDQEGRAVGRYAPPGVDLPRNASTWGAEYEVDPAAAIEAYIAEQRRVAADLCAAGINVNFAPVLDVDTAGGAALRRRTFGSDPTVVAAFAEAAALAYADSGVAPVGKHFPGHGATGVDSHLRLPRIDMAIAQWETTHLPPFETAIEAGLPMLMVGHLAYTLLDPSGEPASLSPVIVTDLLRGELGFEGVVITDDLGSMRALDALDGPERAVRAIEAGVDIALIASGPKDAGEAATALIDAVGTGRLSLSTIDEAVERVLKLKTALGLVDGHAVC